MWTPDKSKLVKVRLHNQGEDVETAWAEDSVSVDQSSPTRRVRLGNVPFLHAKPTYGDVIEVRPDEADGMLDWDRERLAFEHVGRRIHADGGRWAMIIDYEAVPPERDANGAFKALDIAAENADIAVEGAFVAKDGRGGRAYLAVPRSKSVSDVLASARESQNRESRQESIVARARSCRRPDAVSWLRALGRVPVAKPDSAAGQRPKVPACEKLANAAVRR